MTNVPITQNLAQLGDTTPEAVVARFTQVREGFEQQAEHAADPVSWEIFELKWTGRKSGVLTMIADNWLKPAPTELKRTVGQEFQKLKAHVEERIRALASAKEAAQDRSVARDQIYLSLPGVGHAIGTRHLFRHNYE